MIQNKMNDWGNDEDYSSFYSHREQHINFIVKRIEPFLKDKEAAFFYANKYNDYLTEKIHMKDKPLVLWIDYLRQEILAHLETVITIFPYHKVYRILLTVFFPPLEACELIDKYKLNKEL